MTVIVKICGLATQAGLDAALACGADMAGFVFFDKSPRHVSLELAANLGQHVRIVIGKIGAMTCGRSPLHE